MRIFKALTCGLLATLLLACPAKAQVAGAGCTAAQLGTSTISTNRQHIIACLLDSSGGYFWKSFTEDSTPRGTVAFFELAACPTGWVMANGANGTRDLRGEFLRGWDAGRGADPGRTRGSWQNDMFETHTHGIQNRLNDRPIDHDSDMHETDRGVTTALGTASGAAGGEETRPRNVAMLICQKT